MNHEYVGTYPEAISHNSGWNGKAEERYVENSVRGERGNVGFCVGTLISYRTSYFSLLCIFPTLMVIVGVFPIIGFLCLLYANMFRKYMIILLKFRLFFPILFL